ncbi:hypothetical protein CIB84_015454 [Bambusicola thoracicus]|uniref:Uncharacterized protein n=1 Tax=Bambusicola thoracicus TaxID=9083 RepID=A0A2P4S9M2_BAMTH|nr:hypothetical protein CIB84_015454 [Bambusicola thoracicus]
MVAAISRNSRYVLSLHLPSLAEKELYREGSGGPAGQQGDWEPAVCPDGQEDRWCPGWPTVGQRLTVRQQHVLVAKKVDGLLVGQQLTSG